MTQSMHICNKIPENCPFDYNSDEKSHTISDDTYKNLEKKIKFCPFCGEKL